MKSVSDIEYDLDTLLEGETLLSFPEVADRLGVPVTKVHDYVGAGKLVAHKADGVNYIPEALLSGDELSKFVGGAIRCFSTADTAPTKSSPTSSLTTTVCLAAPSMRCMGMVPAK